jgi:ribosome-associated heat shock protein Hsp15
MIKRSPYQILNSMSENKAVRIDKYLWAVRLYKTRSIASEECRKGRIVIKDVPVKPSRNISKDEIIIVRKPPVTYTFRILEPIENRVSAKIAGQFIEDLTPESEKTKLEIAHSGGTVFRDRGTGRPTKKERRLIDKYRNGKGES